MRIFLADFLKAHDIDKEGIDIVFENMDTDGNGMIDKYEMAVFFLKVASYEELVVKNDIEKYTGFSPPTK